MTRRSAPRQEPLSRQRILDAAIALLERDGAAALSMRRLAGELGVEAMSLYHHIEGRGELLRELSERLFRPLEAIEPAANWRETCRRFANALRGIAVTRPATFQLMGLQPLETPLALRPIEILLGSLVGDGFSPGEALTVYRSVASYARGYALAEVAGFTVDAADREARERLRTLPADDFPVLNGRVDELAAVDADGSFERGLDALLRGLPDPN